MKRSLGRIMIVSQVAATTRFEQEELMKLYRQFQMLGCRRGDPATITVGDMKEALALVSRVSYEYASL